jgi:hypothetical protein
MAYYATADGMRYSFIKPRPPAISREIAPAPLPRPDLEAAAVASDRRQVARTVEALRMACEMKELAEGFLAHFEARR